MCVVLTLLQISQGAIYPGLYANLCGDAIPALRGTLYHLLISIFLVDASIMNVCALDSFEREPLCLLIIAFAAACLVPTLASKWDFLGIALSC